MGICFSHTDPHFGKVVDSIPNFLDVPPVLTIVDADVDADVEPEVDETPPVHPVPTMNTHFPHVFARDDDEDSDGDDIHHRDGDGTLENVADALNLQHISDRENLDHREHMVKRELIPKSAASSPTPGHRQRLISNNSTSSLFGNNRVSSVGSDTEDVPLRRSNSTGTLFVDSTVSQPNKDHTLGCVALAIHFIILDGHEQADPLLYSDQFDEMMHPLTDDVVPETYATDIPEIDDIVDFMNRLFEAAALSAECGIVTLVYINRAIQYTNLAMHASNWKRVLLGCILMASKVWDDQAVWNVDYCSILPKIEVDDMNDLERTLLEMLQFNINVDSSVYTKYYFELRSLAEQADRPFPLERMSTSRASKLEATSKHVRDVVLAETLRGAKSMDSKEFTAHAVLP
eukprot:m.73374 g.73374  ORF g.73374 m.73374 type:complete len:402 (-) comp24551_c0_seq1:336-1541(-)